MQINFLSSAHPPSSPPPAIHVDYRRKVMFYYAHPHYWHKRQRANQLLFDFLCLTECPQEERMGEWKLMN